MATDKYRQYDLHCHSTASDGELSPTALVEHAVDHGVELLALTDHDVTDGLAEAAAAAQRVGLEFVTGVEISVSWNKYLLHIVGLNFDMDNQALQQGLAGLRSQRDARAEEMARRLEKLGFDDTLAGARHYAGGQILSRTHFARHLYESGYVKTLQEAFDRYLGTGKPAYVKTEWTSLGEAVGWIRSAGGRAVIAHPGRYKLSATKLRNLIQEFKEAGGEGLEVISGSQDINMTRNLADYARRYELYASIGSDYHGPSQTWRNMGRLPPLPDGCEPIWHLWQGGNS
jgi:predicted metal-dependent phosphoesterase TrpH